MDLIDDIDLIGTLIGFESSLFDQVSHILDTVVRGSIDLDTVEHISLIKSDTVTTGMARVSILQIFAIDSLREYASGRRLPSSTRTREDIGVSDATLDEGSAQDSRDRILSDDRVPVAGTILGIERHIRGEIMS